MPSAADAVANLGQRLGGIELIAAGHGVHEIGGDEAVDGIATAIRFDHDESKIVVPTRPAFSGWRGLRVRVIFCAAPSQRRLNLVEGDDAFALFIEPGGKLCGTINDGSVNWWGVSSEPGRVTPGRWHFAELLYDTGHLLALSLNGQLVGIRMTAGLPLRPVGGTGIRVGYWPGGDARYTFRGQMGPVWIDTLDERDPIVEIINKAQCAGSDDTSRLEAMNAALEDELSVPERHEIRQFGKTIAASLNRIAAVVIGQAADPAETIDQLTALAEDVGRLAAAHEAAGSDMFGDPALATLIQELYSAAFRENPAAPRAFVMEAMKLLAAAPMTPERWAEIRLAHPEFCASSVPPVDLEKGNGPGAGGVSWLDDLIAEICKSRQSSDGAAAAKPSRPCEPCTPKSP